ncbi:hypothetical protein [Streptomyces caatingaensis]|nr:hypothetical protein [Streptomyces caatingaensis]
MTKKNTFPIAEPHRTGNPARKKRRKPTAPSDPAIVSGAENP